MSKHLVGVLLALAAHTAEAQEVIGVRADALKGKRLQLENGNIAHYRSDGTYTFTGNRRSPPGRWRIEAGGRVCVDFVDGRKRCDNYVEKGGALFIRNSRGSLYKVRFVN